MRDREEAVFRALANGYRRTILDLLARGPRTTGEVAEALPELSRFAAMQHLRVLEGAGLVLVRREGRQRFNHLNAVPVREVYERWVDRLAGDAAGGALALKRHVEGREKPMQANGQALGQAIRIENEIRIRAPKEAVYRAFTTEQAAWYPHSYGGERVKAIVFEEHVGGKVYEDWGDGKGYLYGHVAYYDPPNVLCTRGHLKAGINLEQWTTLEQDGEETILRYSMTAFGDIGPEMAQAIKQHGDLELTADNLRAWVERGERVAG